VHRNQTHSEPVPPCQDAYETEETCSQATQRMIERFPEFQSAVNFVPTLEDLNSEMSLQCGNQDMRRVGKSKLRTETYWCLRG
jgi:hypothetical protein